MNVLSLFDGISCGRVALERAGIKVDRYFASEIDKAAIEVSKHNYPDIHHIGDIFSVDFTKYTGNIDIVMGGSPCFVAGTLIRTIDGLKAIEDIKVGDKVLTHKNRFKTVTTIMSRVAPSTVIVKAENCGEIECTKEHPFYTKEMNRVYNSDKRHSDRVLSDDFSWTSPENFYKETDNSNIIKRQTYLTSVTDNIKEVVKYNGVDIKTNQFSTKHVNNLNLNDTHLWYIIGRWVGDGWYNYKYRVRKKLAGIKICCGKHEVEGLEEKIRLTGLHYYKSEEKTTYRFTIYNLELALYLKRFGDGAKNKHLSSETYCLPDNLALSFLNGYFDADGCIQVPIGGFSTVSKELAYGIKYMINKYMGISCSIIKETNYNDMIEGRLVNVNVTYIGSFRLNKQKQSHYFVEDSYILAPYKSVTYLNEPKTVYNISVEDDESYIANGLVVHNCTYWSIAKAGRETTPDGEGGRLFLKFKEAIDIVRPKYFLYENNYSISDNIKEFITKSLGVPYIVINSALVSAQNRRICYWTNIPGVVVPEDKGILFKDILESGVVGRYKSLTLLKSYSAHSGSQKYLVERDLVKSMHSAVFERVVTPVCLCMKRIDEGKRLRKDYEKGKIKHKFNEYRELVPRDDNKSNTLTIVVKDNLVLFRREDCSFEETDIRTDIIDGEYLARPLTPVECERLQTLPENFTSCVAKTQRYKQLGNGWTVDVIAHIFSFIPDKG